MLTKTNVFSIPPVKVKKLDFMMFSGGIERPGIGLKWVNNFAHVLVCLDTKRSNVQSYTNWKKPELN